MYSKNFSRLPLQKSSFSSFLQSLMSSDEMLSTDDDEEEESSDDLHPDLGRLYFALRYDQHR